MEENSSSPRGGGEQRERRGKGLCPFPRAGFQEEAGPSQGRREGLGPTHIQNFNYYVALGMLRSEARFFFFATQRSCFYCLNVTVSHWPPQDYTGGEYAAAINLNFNRQWGLGNATNLGSAPAALMADRL